MNALVDRFDVECIGVEPFPLYTAAIAPRRILRATAEALPFQNSAFDLVIMKDVIEHVDDVDRALCEAIRVSRKYIYILAPNYLFPYEAHFKRPFIPLMPKSIARLYLRAIGVDANQVGFIDHINYVHKTRMIRAVERCDRLGELVAVIDLQVSKKFRSSDFFKRLLDRFTNSKFELLLVKRIQE